MKRIMLILFIGASAITWNVNPASAQVTVSEKPTPPQAQLAAPKKPGPGYVLIPAHWIWHRPSKMYVWVGPHWVSKQENKKWAPGHWEEKSNGWKWIPGRWEKIKKRQFLFFK
ncbi:MAG TPA: hypothetical protein VKA27_17605 [Sunxiuqinia sp.]|nr:hypothetical protein [Sunxiuqinia sp.]